MPLMLMLLLLGSQHASGVEVYEGVESVLLPCQVQADVTIDSTAAVWDREELKDPTVHVRLPSGDDFKDQNIRYFSRTSLRAEALQTGDLSLTLRKPTVSDSGTYTCTYRKHGQDRNKAYVDLKVTELPPRSAVWFKVLSGVLVPVVLLAVMFAAWLSCRYKTLKNKEVGEVEVGSGVTSAKLPCKATVHLSQVNKVVWKDRDGRIVHVYQEDSEKPHRRYRSRTEMIEDPLKTGDLSLTLKYPTHTARDTYTCTAYSREGKVLMEKKVELKVEECKVEVEEGAESVSLPFQTTENQPEDTEVVWERHEPEYMKVHVYENGSDQPDKQDEHYRGRTEMNEDALRSGDLSLTLRHLKVGDAGRYGCEVNSKEAWRYKRVWLTVKVKDISEQMVLKMLSADTEAC
ncbi:butyrophilin-like protein 2 [Astatotilapia calliptera]|uniref:butyrophilin-like protein 2 n=1 Tax=Astatotilapia calliptera TaxID=8154 RepID=UPI000E420A04|nr:butyrophilin-like protein 2 [Astatotilapia calliptera]